MAFDPKTGNDLSARFRGEKDCSDPIIVGQPSYNYDWVLKPDNNDIYNDIDLELKPECIPWYYYNMRVGSIYAHDTISFYGQGEVISNSGAHVLSNKKNLPFDMPHPTKKGWRLRHVCLEGPEIGVYLHGKAKGKVIQLPDYWRGLVKEETISVHLTPIGSPYVLFIEKIEDNKIYVGTNWQVSGVDIEYNYVIHASRYDDDLIVEYEGESHLDYPGGNEGYSFNYEHNYVENLINESIEKTVLKMKENNNASL